MSIRLLPGQSRDHALSLLQERRNALSNINGDAKEVLRKYLEWGTDSMTQVGSVAVPEDASRLVHSPTYDRLLHLFAMLDLDAPVGMERSRVINGLVQAETAARTAALEAAITALRTQIARWSGTETFMLCDTNFYLQSALSLGEPGFVAVFGKHLHGVRIIVPMIVVEELDRAKHGRDEFRGRAQVTLAKLDALFANPTDLVDLEPKILQPVGADVAVPFGGTTIELLFDAVGHVRIGNADSEIIDRALAVQSLADRPVTLVTHDTNMSMKARVAGLQVLKLITPPRPPSTRQQRRDRKASAETTNGADWADQTIAVDVKS